MCVCVCLIYHYVSSTAHILLCVRPTHQYASVQPRIHYVLCQIYKYILLYVRPTHQLASVQPHIHMYQVHYTSMSVKLHIYSNMYVQHTSMRQFNRTYTCVCPIYQYVSSTAHMLLCVCPTHQYASIQPHIHVFYVQYTSMSVQLHIYSYTYVQHTSTAQFNHTNICLRPLYQYVSSTAHILAYVGPTKPVRVSSTTHTCVQYTSTSVQLPIYSICTSNTPVCVCSTEHICVRPIYRHVLVQLQTVGNLQISRELMFLSQAIIYVHTHTKN